MTACLTGGDAIGNYIEMLRSAFADRYEFAVFADRGTRDRDFLPSYAYVPTPEDILWFHYSIGSENFAVLRKGDPDFKIMDFHGVCPPEHFSEDEAELKRLTAQALKRLPDFRDVFDLCIVHSDYSENVLREAGYRQVVKSPLAIGRALAEAEADAFLDERLSRLEYLLFVGRVVAQKDVLGALEMFARVRERRPSLKMWVVGDRSASPQYQKDLAVRAEALGVAEDVGFTGKLAGPHLLKPFFQRAKLLVMFSRWESFCVPIVEAMGFGVPAVTTECTCVPEIMGGTGIVGDRSEIDAMTGKVLELLENTDVYEEKRRQCLARAPQFTEAAMAERLYEIEKGFILPGVEEKRARVGV
jgi:glycosyltransferase involved in cell wall biosynthesis